MKLFFLFAFVFSGFFVQAFANTKTTLIFIHGAPGNKDLFNPYLNDPELKAQAQIITYDRPTYQMTDGIRTVSNLDDQVLFLKNLITAHASGSKVILIGYSYGAVIALKAAQKLGQLVNGIVTVGGIFNPADVVVDRRLQVFKFDLLYPQSLEKYHLAYHEISNLKFDLQNILGDLAQIKCPVLAIHGLKDTNVSYLNALFLKQKFEDLSSGKMKNKFQLSLPPNANHFLFTEDFQLIKAELLSFIQAHSSE